MSDGIKGADGGNGKKPIHVIVGGGGGAGVGSGAVGGGGAGYSTIGWPGAKSVNANLSFIEPDEEQTAQDLIDVQFKMLTKSTERPEGITFREHARLTRYFCAVKIYVRPEELKTVDRADGTKGTLYIPDSVRAEDRYQSCAGLVVSLGPQAFKDKDGNPRGQRYKVGDWVVFPRTDIIRIDFCGIPMGIMTDDRAVIVTDDPTYWAQGSITFKA